jgi:hypothetical protein
MAVELDTIRKIARLQDPEGVLSVYADVAPQETGGSRPAWDEQVRLELGRLAERAGAVRSRIHALGPRIERLLDPRADGRGRALFATVTGADLYEVRVGVPLATTVALGPHPQLLPLLGAFADGRPVGLATLSINELRLLELQLGDARELERLDVSQPGFEWSLRKEPNAGVIENLRRSAGIAAEETLRTARRRRWDAVVVAGNPRVARPLAAALEEAGLHVDRDDADPAPELTTAALAHRYGPHAEAIRREGERRLVERLLAEAAAGGRAVLGAEPVIRAFAEGRVGHLVLDAGSTHPGAADGMPLPDVAGEMIGRAFATDAEVTAVNGRAALELADAGGVGALLRW